MATFKKYRITSSSSATMISDLIDDELVEILCRLPPKDMVSCKCVSKLWLELISKVCVPRITSTPVHALIFNTCSYPPNKQKGPWSVACLDSSSDDYHQPIMHSSLVESCLGNILPFCPSPDDFLDCCNGFLLFFDPSSMQYYICNPSTQECIAIPNSPHNVVPICAALVFDPYCKVVYITNKPPELNIFSMVTCQWSQYCLVSEISISGLFWAPRDVYLDGSLYRLCRVGYLFKFDLTQMGCWKIKLPISLIKADPTGSIGVSQGSLHYGWDDRKSNLMVWIHNVKGGQSDEWILKYTISLQYFSQHPLFDIFHECSPVKVLAFHPTSNKVFVGNYAGILCYDMGTMKLDMICALSEDKVLFSKQDLVFHFSINLTPLSGFSKSIPKELSGGNQICCVH